MSGCLRRYHWTKWVLHEPPNQGFTRLCLDREQGTGFRGGPSIPELCDGVLPRKHVRLADVVKVQKSAPERGIANLAAEVEVKADPANLADKTQGLVYNERTLEGALTAG